MKPDNKKNNGGKPLQNFVSEMWTDKGKKLATDASQQQARQGIAKDASKVIAQDKGEKSLFVALYLLRKAEAQRANDATAHAQAMYDTQ